MKQVTDYENIKYEVEHENIKPLETQDVSLILQQNRDLIIYVNKIKKHLSKSFVAIRKMQQLEQENTNLRYENEDLKRENYKLKNYIEKTFLAVKHLFNFPISRFKCIIEDFIKNFQK